MEQRRTMMTVVLHSWWSFFIPERFEVAFVLGKHSFSPVRLLIELEEV